MYVAKSGELQIIDAGRGDNRRLIPMDPSLWDIDWSVGTPPHPTPYSGGSWYIEVPVASGADTGPTSARDPSCPHLNMVAANPGGPCLASWSRTCRSRPR
jgi:hypothetical protein